MRYKITNLRKALYHGYPRFCNPLFYGQGHYVTRANETRDRYGNPDKPLVQISCLDPIQESMQGGRLAVVDGIGGEHRSSNPLCQHVWVCLLDIRHVWHNNSDCLFIQRKLSFQLIGTAGRFWLSLFPYMTSFTFCLIHTGVKALCIFCFEICTPEGRGGKREGMKISK